MHKIYTSLGLMSGTSGDGVDASIIKSDGLNDYKDILNEYFKYDSNIFNSFHSLKEKVSTVKDLKKYNKEIKELERKITLFHAKIIKKLDYIDEEFLVGFHGQTIYHSPDEKISKQLGDGRLLNQLTNKKIIYNFRQNDILNGGEGAPLTPIFHQMIAIQKKIKFPICILNIGGISNITILRKGSGFKDIVSKDIGPGNCLIDSWVRKNSDKNFDKDGLLAASGKKNEIILEQAQELFHNRQNKKKLSFDTNDFDISFSRGLSLEDGAATLTDFTANIIAESLFLELKKENSVKEILICGGGRKNQILLSKIKDNLSPKLIIRPIDDFDINGDFVESQAFGYLAIRSFKKLPITFPNTTKCNIPCLGGELIEN